MIEEVIQYVVNNEAKAVLYGTAAVQIYDIVARLIPTEKRGSIYSKLGKLLFKISPKLGKLVFLLSDLIGKIIKDRRKYDDVDLS